MAWRLVADRLVIPTDSAARHIVSHDGWRANESKGSTPGPLAGLFPFWHTLPPALERGTLKRYLRLANEYVGSPMLSALYGVWACWAGERALAARLLDEGYAQMHVGRFLQQLEQRPDREPDKPRAGPFFANMGGFLSGLLFGLPAIRVGPEEPTDWPRRSVILPAAWKSIVVERAWIRGKPARIVARHGAGRSDGAFFRRRAAGGCYPAPLWCHPALRNTATSIRTNCRWPRRRWRRDSRYNDAS